MATKTTHSARKRAVRTEALLFDEALTRSVLQLTAPDVTSKERVREILAPLLRDRVDLKDYRPTKGGPPPENLFDLDQWEQARQSLFGWCEQISDDQLDSGARQRLIRSLNTWGGQYHLKIAERGLTLWKNLETPGSLATRALFPFFSEHGWSRDRLFRCRLSTCGRWFLRPTKSGTPAEYCSAKHSNLARVWRSRGSMSITMRLVSPARLADAPMRRWLEGLDAFRKAGGSDDTPSAVLLDEAGNVREILFYKSGGVDLLARVRVGEDGTLKRVEQL